MDLTYEEQDILEHAKLCHLHVKKAGRHSGHRWYCFECPGMTCSSLADQERHQNIDHKSFNTDRAIKHHMMETHGVQW